MSTYGNLEIKHLRMIQAIAETGNMTNAATKLYISQSALSQQLKNIEEKLQVTFFFRTQKKMVLTQSGKTLLQTANDVLQSIDATELELAKLSAGEQGELKVGTHCIFCFKWLPDVLQRFQKKFPNIDIEIGTSHEPTMELDEKVFDIIITGKTLSEKDYHCQPLFQDQLVCIMHKNHPLHEQQYIAPSDFMEMNLISHAEKGSRILDLVLGPSQAEPKRLMTIGQPQAILELVAANLGVAVFPLWALQSDRPHTSIITRPISQSGLPLTWSAVSLKNDAIPIFQQEFIRIIKRMNISQRTAQTPPVL